MNIKKFIELHRFFCRESRRFVGVWSNEPYYPFFESAIYIGRYVYRFKDWLYFPIAYIKFMYYSFK